MNDSLEKVKHLVMKALSTDSEEEARTCALLALKIASKNGVLFGGSPMKPSSAADEVLRGALIAATLRAEEAERVSNVLKMELSKMTALTSDVESGRWMKAKYESFCLKCSKPHGKGDKIWWIGPRRGVFCASCAPAARPRR